MNSSEKEFWKSAVKEELASMESNKVWKLVERPKPTANGKKPNIIDAIWVFKKKVDADGLVKHKARLVGRGYKDKNEYDLRETYAPVSRLSLIRASLSVINKLDLHVCQMDVKTAFLNGKFEDKIFMEIPDGLEVHSETRRTKVCKLEKSIYGLKKVSLKRWYEKFVKEAQKLGLTNDMHDPCLFTWRHNGKMVFVVLYVDDMLIASNDLEKLNEVKIRLSNVFEMKDLGEPKNFLGMTIQRNRSKREILIHQADYTERILEKFNMEGSNPKDTPMETRQVSNRNKRRKSEKFEEKEGQSSKPVKKVPYREAIGSLMYLANATRPDIAYAVNFLARKQLDPTEEDWNNVQRVFRSLKGTSKQGLRFISNLETLEGFTDSSCRDLPGSNLHVDM